MSLSKEAIQHIQDAISIPKIQAELNELAPVDPSIIIPSNMKVESLEGLMEFRSSYRLGFDTVSIKDYIQYCKDQEIAGTTCFIDPVNMSSKTIFDLGSIEQAGHQRHKATISLMKLAAYKALLNVESDYLSQKSASDFIEDWQDSISIFTEAGDVMTPKAASRALRNLTVKAAKEVNSSVGDFEASMSAMEKIEAKDKDKLPSTIDFRCEPYLGFSEVKFTISVSILTGSDIPKYSFRIIRLESKKEEIAEEFRDKLVSDLGEEIKVYLGSV